MKIVRWGALLMAAGVMLAVLGCSSEKVIIPVYDTAFDQFVFAKKIKDHAYLVAKKEHRQKEFEHAILAYQKVIEIFPQDEKFLPLAILSTGDCYFEMRDFKKAAATYEQALKKYPEQKDIQALALYGAGSAYDRLKEHKKAQRYYKDCVERFGNETNPVIKDVVEQAKIQYGKIKEQ